MRSDNATQNAMQWKCIALRRTAARKLPLLPPYGRRNQESLNCLFQCLYSTRLVSIRAKTNPFLGGFSSIYRSKLLPAFLAASAAKFMRRISWLLSCCCSLCSCCCSLCIDPCLACCCFDDPPLAAVSGTISVVLQARA